MNQVDLFKGKGVRLKHKLKLIKMARDAETKKRGTAKALIDAAVAAGLDITKNTYHVRIRDGRTPLEAILEGVRPKKPCVVKRNDGTEVSLKELSEESGVPYQTLVGRRKRHPGLTAEGLVCF